MKDIPTPEIESTLAMSYKVILLILAHTSFRLSYRLFYKAVGSRYWEFEEWFLHLESCPSIFQATQIELQKKADLQNRLKKIDNLGGNK